MKRMMLFLLVCLALVWPDDAVPHARSGGGSLKKIFTLGDQQSSEAWLEGFKPMYGGRFDALRGANGHAHTW